MRGDERTDQVGKQVGYTRCTARGPDWACLVMNGSRENLSVLGVGLSWLPEQVGGYSDVMLGSHCKRGVPGRRKNELGH